MAYIPIYIPYVVGTNQLKGKGDQQKLFVSKSTLIFADYDFLVKFNNMNNVAVHILKNTWYEFKVNIFQVFKAPYDANYTTDIHIYMYFEGVMYDEARRPE